MIVAENLIGELLLDDIWLGVPSWSGVSGAECGHVCIRQFVLYLWGTRLNCAGAVDQRIDLADASQGARSPKGVLL